MAFVSRATCSSLLVVDGRSLLGSLVAHRPNGDERLGFACDRGGLRRFCLIGMLR